MQIATFLTFWGRFFWRSIQVSMLVALLVLAGWFAIEAHHAKSLADAGDAREENRPIPVRTAVVTAETYEQTVGATGVTRESVAVVITYGWSEGVTQRDIGIAKVFVAEGRRVQAGDVLFQVEDEIFQHARRQAELEVEADEAFYQAYERLFRGGAASGFEVTTAKVDLESSRLKLQVAERDLLLTKLRSPIDGYVGTVNVAAGGQIASSQALTTIYQLTPIHMRVDLPQEQLDQVTLGQPAEVVLDSFSQETFRGTVIGISPQVDEKTRAVAVIVEMANQDGRMKAGISGFARFRRPKHGTLVPDIAVIQLQTKAMVFTVADGRARVRPIRTGPLVKTGVRTVVDGLEPGEDVVVYGQQYLQEGDLVDVNWRHWSRRE